MAKMIIMKQCSACKQIKPFSEFYKNRNTKDGFQTECKDCRRISSKKYEQSEKGLLVRKKQRQTIRYKEYQKKYQKIYEQTEIFKARKKKYARCNTEKRKAQGVINHAVRTNKMPSAKTFKCSCGEQAKHYHHPNYNKEHWFNVVPVCVLCHIKIHKSLLSKGLRLGLK